MRRQLAEKGEPVCLPESLSAGNPVFSCRGLYDVCLSLSLQKRKVFFVTHSFELAHGFYVEGMDAALFLRAERQADGRRTFRLVEGEPLPTGYGEDLYDRIFGEVPDVQPVTPRM